MTNLADSLATLRTQITADIAAYAEDPDMADVIGDTWQILRMIEDIELDERAGRSTEASDKWAFLMPTITDWSQRAESLKSALARRQEAGRVVLTLWRDEYPQARTLGELVELGGNDVRHLVDAAFA
jgi:hypothetical protein